MSSANTHYEPIAFSAESTVVAEFVPNYEVEQAYQTEFELEEAFIKQLQGLSYEYISIHSAEDLERNLRRQLEELNGMQFSNAEWKRFFGGTIARRNEGLVEKTKRIHRDKGVELLERDNGQGTKNIRLVDVKNIHRNRLQVIHQYEAEGSRRNRYDVTILVNGLPMVHIELKRRGVHIREAFNQINRYKRESFWADSGLFEYVQLFVISNGTNTKYYSNTVRHKHVQEQQSGALSGNGWQSGGRAPSGGGYGGSGALSGHGWQGGSGGQESGAGKTLNSFSFTSFWTDEQNTRINDLRGFTQTFFAKGTLLRILLRYSVFDVDNKLLVLRPYQIAAIEKILERIAISRSYKTLGTRNAGGFIWHTTGSGKTLTSFKLAQILRDNADIKKILFVVDRRDLDYQTMREYERFEKGAANSNTSTQKLKEQLESPSPSNKVIITTIQKLSRYVKQHKRTRQSAYADPVVLIFDECHRSQFGSMHADITKFFKNYNLFGFTGTPIFTANAQGGAVRRTTEEVFGAKLHTYTIVDAIGDNNVLPFRIEYNSTVKTQGAEAGPQTPTQSEADSEAALLAPERIRTVVEYILDRFDQKTKRSQSGNKGFNSIFATASIRAAKQYYQEFMEQQKNQIKIGLIYSYTPNPELDADEEFETDRLAHDDRTFLEGAIRNYNAMFRTTYDTSSEKFQNYYKDLAQKLRGGSLDMAIVVNMFLTGFDSTTLNTLWVDKPLRDHGLIQAFSRTNRILDSVKTCGNIVSFRNLEQATNDALALFGNKDARSIAIIKPYEESYAEYQQLIHELTEVFPVKADIKGEAMKRAFVQLYGRILRLRNILSLDDKFEGKEILSERNIQDYQSKYLDMYKEFRDHYESESEHILDDLEFEIELIKQVDVNMDYILMLVEEYAQAQAVKAPAKSAQPIREHERALHANIEGIISASPNLRNKKDLIEQFLALISEASFTSTSTQENIRSEWSRFIEKQRSAELNAIIASENLNAQQTKKFIADAFRKGSIPSIGTALNIILPPTSRFPRSTSNIDKSETSASAHSAPAANSAQKNELAEKKRTVLAKLTAFFERYFGL